MNTVSIKLNNESSVLKLQVTINMEIILSCLLINSIIAQVKDEIFAAARKLLEMLLQEIDTMLLETKDPGVRICKFLQRTLNTSFGKINFKYRQAKKDGIYFSPLLRKTGVKSFCRTTGEAKEKYLKACLFTSFRKSQKLSDNFFSSSTLWRYLQQYGKVYRDRVNRAIYYYGEGDATRDASPLDFAVVMIDEIWIRGHKKKKWERVKVARLEIARHLEGKYVFDPLCAYATVESQKVFLKKTKEFFDAISGLSQVENIIVLTDGCPMGKRFCGFYPGKAAWQLDWWHLWNYIHRGCRFEPDLEKEIWELINVEKIDEALAILCAYREAMGAMEERLKKTLSDLTSTPSITIKPGVFWSSRQLDELKRLIKYLENNRDGIYGVKAFVGKIPPEYFVFGSGPVERLQAVMIAYRMKGQGKHWSVAGAENMVSLLSREQNGRYVEDIIESGLEGLMEWENLNSSSVFPGSSINSLPDTPKPCNLKFCPLPSSSLYMLRRGKIGPFYHRLKNLSARKMLSAIANFRAERGDAAN